VVIKSKERSEYEKYETDEVRAGRAVPGHSAGCGVVWGSSQSPQPPHHTCGRIAPTDIRKTNQKRSRSEAEALIASSDPGRLTVGVPRVVRAGMGKGGGGARMKGMMLDFRHMYSTVPTYTNLMRDPACASGICG